MSQLDTLVSAVIDITKRPELTSLTQTAVQLATMRAHSVDKFPRDHVVYNGTYIVNTSAPFIDFPNLSSVLTRYRLLDMIEGIDASSGFRMPVEFLEYRDYKDWWDTDGVMRNSLYCTIGDTLRMQLQNQTGMFNAHYFQMPDTSSATFNSWIATNHPNEIAMWAAGIIWQRVGNQEQANATQQEHVTPFKDLLVGSYLLGGSL